MRARINRLTFKFFVLYFYPFQHVTISPAAAVGVVAPRPLSPRLAIDSQQIVIDVPVSGSPVESPPAVPAVLMCGVVEDDR